MPVKTQSKPHRCGFTLIETLVVLVIVVAVAGMAVPLLSGLTVAANGESKTAQKVATEATLSRVRSAILGNGSQTGYLSDMGSLPLPDTTVDPTRTFHPQLHFLFVNPNTGTADANFDPAVRRGWRGPYLIGNGTFSEHPAFGFMQMYGKNGDNAVLDGWGRPLVIQQSTNVARLVSAGEDGNLLTTDDNVEVTLR